MSLHLAPTALVHAPENETRILPEKKVLFAIAMGVPVGPWTTTIELQGAVTSFQVGVRGALKQPDRNCPRPTHEYRDASSGHGMKGWDKNALYWAGNRGWDTVGKLDELAPYECPVDLAAGPFPFVSLSIRLVARCHRWNKAFRGVKWGHCIVDFSGTLMIEARRRLFIPSVKRRACPNGDRLILGRVNCVVTDTLSAGFDVQAKPLVFQVITQRRTIESVGRIDGFRGGISLSESLGR